MTSQPPSEDPNFAMWKGRQRQTTAQHDYPRAKGLITAVSEGGRRALETDGVSRPSETKGLTIAAQSTRGAQFSRLMYS